ncbi:MAG TPA: 3-oxoacyl-[acyl-carrier-protein] synthase III C-terminal domain-containing protein [Acidobacteriaceae bacterium]
MKVASVARALPPYRYTQQQIFEALSEQWKGKLENPALLSRFHHRVGVETRHLVMPFAGYANLTRWSDANRIWLEKAEELGEQSIDLALERAGLTRDRIDALLTVSVTGIASPSLDAHLANRMHLRKDIRRTPIFGLGCVAGAAGIAQAADYVRAWPDRVAVLLSVELCSLTWQRNDLSIANLISSGLFADGAAAVVVSGDDVVADGPEIVDTASSFYPDTEDAMGWEITDDGFRIVLSPEVPAIIRAKLPADVDALLCRNGLKRANVGSWILHTGGPKVLDAMSDSLGLERTDVSASWDSLREVGNLSSASVLLVLEDVMLKHRPAPGTWSVLAALGPGFCGQLVLLRW